MADVRKATAADVDALAATLSRAFYDDPVIEWLAPDPRRRTRALPVFFRSQLRGQYLRQAETYTADVSDGLAGGALWSPPGRDRPSLSSMLRLAPIVPALGRRTIDGLRLFAQADKQRPRHTPHFYLGVLGTDPDQQGKGYGSALLEPVLERCDREGLPAYLESSKESNVPFYARHGWKVTEEVTVPGGDVRLWLMWREPG
jgi:GNAT superfamily N-acetyltransferase